MKKHSIGCIILALTMVLLFPGCIETHENAAPNCTLSACDCRCYPENQLPELNGTFCNVNCLAQKGAVGCEYKTGQCATVYLSNFSNDSCTTDLDCGGAQCCHPDACVNNLYKEDCAAVLCSAECFGPLDCGKGSCSCDNGRCTVKEQNQLECARDEDCACGTNIYTRDCFLGNRQFVNTTQQCPDFCGGIGGNLVLKCVDRTCRQVSRTQTKKCSNDSQCVREQCCHADSCINTAYKTPCYELCTNDCSGALDCGKASCSCIGGECSVKELPVDNSSCTTDSDCRPSTCCHANSCVNDKFGPSCDNAFCTTGCFGALDCGKGSCSCINGQCKVKTLPVNNESCKTDSDCAPAQCCHPTTCMNNAFKGVCTELCTNECKGPLDCNRGGCQCVKGKCIVNVTGEKECLRDEDCACGTHIETGQCFFGGKNYVNTRITCPDFCNNSHGSLALRCIDQTCKQIDLRYTTYCSDDSDCVREQCCHATSCIRKEFKSTCSERCTKGCFGPMDCGHGYCGCERGLCSVVYLNYGNGTD